MLVEGQTLEMSERNFLTVQIGWRRKFANGGIGWRAITSKGVLTEVM